MALKQIVLKTDVIRKNITKHLLLFIRVVSYLRDTIKIWWKDESAKKQKATVSTSVYVFHEVWL